MKISKVVAALITLASVSSANAAIIAHWTFETSIPTTAGPHAAELGDNAGVGSPATGFHTVAATAYSNPAGNGSVESFSSNNWSIGDYYQFQTSTVGYTLITIDWCQNRSSTGPGDFTLSVSTDGVNFSPLSSNYVVNAVTWTAGTQLPDSCYAPVAAPASADNQASVFFRMTANVAGAAAGSNRIDDVRISGVPEPTSLGLLLTGAVVVLRRRRM